MEKTRIICIRFPEHLIVRCDQLARHTYNNSRSQVILQLLDNLTQCADDGTLFKMIHEYDAFGRGYKVTFTRDEKKNV